MVDLLGGWKHTVRVNDNISLLFILYQFAILVSTILGPATILFMMAGAYTIVFKTTVIESFLIGIVPALGFIFICFYAKPATQMFIASIMSAVYVIVMTIVLVATLGLAFESGVTNPNVVFLIMLIVVFFVSAIMHPNEFVSVIPGALYFICLPTGYLILTIYYLCNMHIVSWGTREVAPRKTKAEIEQEKRIAEERRKEEKRIGIFGRLGLNLIFKEIVGMFKQFRKDNQSEESKSRTDTLLEELINEIRLSRKPLLQPIITPGSAVSERDMEVNETENNYLEPNTREVSKVDNPILDSTAETEVYPQPLKYSDLENPAWLQSSVTGFGPICLLTDKENIFWKQLIHKYLNPTNEDKAQQAKVAEDLKDLRNNVVFGIFMANAIWIALSVELQILQEELKDKFFLTIPKLTSSKYLIFEPSGVMFLAFFTVILLVQFVGMLVHRWDAVLHMLSVTEVSCGKTTTANDKLCEILPKVKYMQKLCNIENESQTDYETSFPSYDNILDYDENFVNENGTASMNTLSAPPRSFHSYNPPPYHSSTSHSIMWRRRSNADVFDKRGGSRSSVLGKIFEKRYRVATQGQCPCEINQLYTLYLRDNERGYSDV